MEHPLRSPWTSSGTDLNGLIPHPPANPIALRGKNPRLRLVHRVLPAPFLIFSPSHNTKPGFRPPGNVQDTQGQDATWA